MPYSPELIARMRKLHFYEHHTLHAVSKVVGLHRDTVKRLLYGDSDPEKTKKKPKITDAYLDTIKKHIEEYPGIRATTLLSILKDRGYQGSITSLRRSMRPFRKRQSESFKPMSFFQGQQAQVDWAHFGELPVSGGSRKLYLFVVVLSWSRATFAKFTFDQKTDSFLRLHEEAFKYFGGTPRELLYDNLKSAVIERLKDSIKFNPQLVEFSGFYGFEPKACQPYRGNQKGRVERAIRYIRDDFAVTAKFEKLSELNRQLRIWLDKKANARKWVENHDFLVCEQLEKERPYLNKLSERTIEPKLSKPIRSNKCGLVRFDLNDYSIPWQHTREQLTIEADDFTVKFYVGQELVAEHKRSWNRGERLLDPDHWEKRVNKQAVDHLVGRYRELEEIYAKLFDRGEPLSFIKKSFADFHAMYDAKIFARALRIAVKREVYHPRQISRLLVELTKNNTADSSERLHLRKELSELDISSHNLDSYDYL